MPHQITVGHFWRLTTLVAVGLAFAPKLMAYTYGPANRAEWDGWPEYCKARFTESLIGGSSEYINEVPKDIIARWQGEMGLCWRYLHHHCAAVLQLNRAKSALKGSDRRFALESAIREDKLAARFCPASHPFSANIATHTAMTYAEAGDFVSATKTLDWAIQTHPAFPESYLVKSTLLRRSGKIAASIDVLLAGNAATNDGSAEIHNALGFAYLNSRDYEKALEHARKAYALGFPLPGLRNQLAAAGYSL